MPFQPGPVDVPPFLRSRCRCAHDAVLLGSPTFYPCGAPSAYPPAFPEALASGLIPSFTLMRLTGYSVVERE
jgi:hypothetical protein